MNRKQDTMIQRILSFAMLILFSSCVSTNYLTMNVTEPAPVTMEPAIKAVGILDRSAPNESNKKIDKVEQVLSLEGKELDKQGAVNIATGLKDELFRNQRFEKIKVVEKPETKGPGSGIFPAPLSWDMVGSIAKEHNLDALFVLEFFDTDATINYSSAPVTVKGPLGVEVPLIEHTANITTQIKSGWRIYNYQTKTIVDELPVTEVVSLTGKGINPMEAANAILSRKQAVLDMSGKMGENYAWRVMPYRVRVQRNYYVRGTDRFKTAKRMAQTGNWDGAAEQWKLEINNPKAKVAGRAYYNMAISNEINGDLDAAIDWASKAYEYYGNKLALDYLRILKHRKNQEFQLKMQQGE